MTGRTYLALLPIFKYNVLTHGMLRNVRAFPEELQNAKQLLPDSVVASSE